MVFGGVFEWTTTQLGSLVDFFASLVLAAMTMMFGAAYSGGFTMFILFCVGFGGAILFIVLVAGKQIKAAFSYLFGKINSQL